jgi:ethanolamine ammonia-lyase small subunit
METFPAQTRSSSHATVGTVVIAESARVALGDEVGELLDARLLVVLIGERPGLSAADSLGVYVTYSPRPGRTDAERNCISNIRSGGLAPDLAAANLAWLIETALSMKTTGVMLKDRSQAIAGPGEAGAIDGPGN